MSASSSGAASPSAGTSSTPGGSPGTSGVSYSDHPQRTSFMLVVIAEPGSAIDSLPLLLYSSIRANRGEGRARLDRRMRLERARRRGVGVSRMGVAHVARGIGLRDVADRLAVAASDAL